jgi:hypothetical protein
MCNMNEGPSLSPPHAIDEGCRNTKVMQLAPLETGGARVARPCGRTDCTRPCPRARTSFGEEPAVND